MRKFNVFGKRNTQTRPFYLLVLVFVIVIPLYFLINFIQTQALDELKREQAALQQQINVLIDASYESAYHEIGAIIQFLPNAYDQTSILNEIDLVKNASDLALATMTSLTIQDNQASPFSQTLPATVKFVKVTFSLTVDEPDLILTFVENLSDQDRIYHVYSLVCSYLEDGGAFASFTVYTFYNDVVIS